MNRTRLIIFLLPIVILLLSPWSLSQSDTSRIKGFREEIPRVLPIEEPYEYHRYLKQGPVHQPRRDPDTRARPGEMEIAAEGWLLVGDVSAGLALQHALQDFRDYLETSMAVKVDLEQVPSFDEWDSKRRTILAGTREQLPSCGVELRANKDYQLQVSPEQIVVCGFDEAGVIYGLYNLEVRMNLREGPFLGRDLQTTRHSLYQTRMVLNWMGWMEWTDSYLAHLVHDGFDAIFASVYANPNGAEGPSLRADDLYSLILYRQKRQDPARVHELIKRASRFGIKVYTPIIYRFTNEEENEAGLRQLVRDIIGEFPEIKGYILLTEGFYYGT